MEITDIRPTKRGRFSVYLDGEYYCVLHADVYALSGLAVRDSVSEERIGELRAESEERLAKERALRLLGQRAYTEKGLYDKLREKTDERAAAAAVARMAELGLVNDEDYARRYAEEVLATKGFSARRTIQELARRGVDRETAELALEELAPDPEQAIARVVRRKYMPRLGDEKGLARTVAALTRLGYRYSDIKSVIRNLQEDEAYYDEE
jgi:regulatory protein